MEEKVKEKIARLIAKADRKLKVARDLYEDKSYEDSISRAYYAMFQAATALLLTRDIVCCTHSGLLKMFSLYFIKTGQVDKRYFDMLSEAKDLRENGDYEPFFVGVSEDAESAIENAMEFIEKVKQVLKEGGDLR